MVYQKGFKQTKMHSMLFQFLRRCILLYRTWSRIEIFSSFIEVLVSTACSASLKQKDSDFIFFSNNEHCITAIRMSFSPSAPDFLAKSSSSCISDSWSCRSLISVWYCSLSIFTWNSLTNHTKHVTTQYRHSTCCRYAHAPRHTCCLIRT